MKTRNTLPRTMTLLLGLALLGAGALMAGAPQKDNLVVTAKTSSGGVNPTSVGNAPFNNQWFYAYCLPSGSSLNDSIPVDFKLTNTNGVTPETVNISFNAVGSPAVANFITVSGFSISDNGATLTNNISISTGTLADGVYNANVQISGDPSNKVQLSHDTIHIHVFVGAACTGPTCFFTDSDFNLLKKCDGVTDVETNSGGTFLIVANAKGRVVATNPGQFYYNLIWTNPNSKQDVTISFSATNLNPKGANSVHAMVFDTSGFIANLSNWDMVNQDGTPCGPSGPCPITVEAGKTLWVTWHLEYAGIGGPSAGISSSCPGSVTISATGTLSFGPTSATCTATAKGSLKQ